MDIIKTLSTELNETADHVKNVVELLDGGNTVPFIARYRKELTGTMDDQVIRALSDRLTYLRSLEARRAEISAAIEAQEKLTDELSAELAAAGTLAQLEDIYRPFRPKRRTRASMAIERGLEPLAELLLAQTKSAPPPVELAAPYVDAEKDVMDTAAALAGARDIIAERMSDDAKLRDRLRRLISGKSVVRSEKAKEGESVYELYYDFSEPAARIKGYRVLALDRGEREGFLKVILDAPEEEALCVMRRMYVNAGAGAQAEVEAALADSWKRLIWPSLARELRSTLTAEAAEGAINVFAGNLRPLLMQPPVKGKVVLGLDPAFRTGCKVAVVDGTGRVLDTGVVYPTMPHNKVAEAERTLRALIQKHGVTVIAIGNGTASRETERFVADMIHGTPLSYAIVNEAGASVYSASKLGAEEFPDYDVSLRSAVSIARRLQDPLAELVKIDPKSIGVGQYQHDMPEARLGAALDGVVEDCVNSVGVELNTASAALLSRVAGVSAGVAKNIVAYREATGAFKSRRELIKVEKLGPKAFEQCAGFIRVHDSRELLDGTAVHPESYEAAKKLLGETGYTEQDARAGKLGELPRRIRERGESSLAAACGVGAPTLRDIAAELMKPGRDVRDELPPVLLRSDVLELSDLTEGMELMGTVRNVMDFGAFVDIGVHQDGLVHISRISKNYVKHPSDVLKTGDVVRVTVIGVDVKRKRISLSMV